MFIITVGGGVGEWLASVFQQINYMVEEEKL